MTKEGNDLGEGQIGSANLDLSQKEAGGLSRKIIPETFLGRLRKTARVGIFVVGSLGAAVLGTDVVSPPFVSEPGKPASAAGLSLSAQMPELVLSPAPTPAATVRPTETPPDPPKPAGDLKYRIEIPLVVKKALLSGRIQFKVPVAHHEFAFVGLNEV